MEVEVESNIMKLKVYLVGPTGSHSKLINAASRLGTLLPFSPEVLESQSKNRDAVYVMDSFEGTQFEIIKSKGCRIVGPPVIFKTAENNVALPINNRPLYCQLMCGMIVCFTGFKEKDELQRLVTLVQNMGGSVRKDISARVTHLIASTTKSDKYRMAVAYGTEILTDLWVGECWKLRDEITASAHEIAGATYLRLKPFHNLSIAFVGFNSGDEDQVKALASKNGATIVSLEDQYQVVVVDNMSGNELPSLPTGTRADVVTQEWFWTSIQMDVCADTNIFAHNAGGGRSTLLPGGVPSSYRKRRCPEDTLRELASHCDTASSSSTSSPAVKHRRASFSFTASPALNDTVFSLDGAPEPAFTPQITADMSPRHQVAVELYLTESNYVAILSTIITTFKLPLETLLSEGKPILVAEDIRSIFSSLSDIQNVHKALSNQLYNLLASWSETCGIGEAILQHTDSLFEAYKPYINYFEMSQDCLQRCIRTNDRFHAFVKLGQNRSHCHRQTLPALMIRPVQRLPSVILLLQDLIKRTDAAIPDRSRLEEALTKIKAVTNLINEDKRKTEFQVQMFEIHQQIEGIPAIILSSHRKFIGQIDCVQLNDVGTSQRSDQLTLFLFTDALEIGKRKSGATTSVPTFSGGRSPALSGKHSSRNYKHVELLQLSHIKRVVNINETEDFVNVFALVMRLPEEKEKMYAYTIMASSEISKDEWVRKLCEQMGESACRTDTENFLTSLDAGELDIPTTGSILAMNSSTLSRAVKAARKVGRAISLKRTQTPSVVKRAMSSINAAVMSPLSDQRMASSANLTLASPLSISRGTAINRLTRKKRKNSLYASTTTIA